MFMRSIHTKFWDTALNCKLDYSLARNAELWLFDQKLALNQIPRQNFPMEVPLDTIEHWKSNIREHPLPWKQKYHGDSDGNKELHALHLKCKKLSELYEDWVTSSALTLCDQLGCRIPHMSYYYGLKPDYVREGKDFTFDLCIIHENYDLYFHYFKEFALNNCKCAENVDCLIKSSYVPF